MQNKPIYIGNLNYHLKKAHKTPPRTTDAIHYIFGSGFVCSGGILQIKCIQKPINYADCLSTVT